MIIKTIKKTGIKCTLYKLYSRIFPGETFINSACDRIGAYKYLQKYKPVLNNLVFDKNHVYNNNYCHKKIWVCWLQGYDNAPSIVKQCIDSIKKYSLNLDVVLLDNDNIKKYISIPAYIEEKHKKNIIPNAHYADYIRISLLEQYGGIWIDSTVLLTSYLPQRIIKSNLFCFKVQPLGKVNASNWFIAASAGNPFIVQMKALLDTYWQRENHLISYSIFHIFWTMIINHNEYNRYIWESVPYFDDINCKILQMELFEQYSEYRYEEIKNISSIHKLTYKFDYKLKDKSNTFYKNIFS